MKKQFFTGLTYQYISIILSLLVISLTSCADDKSPVTDSVAHQISIKLSPQFLEMVNEANFDLLANLQLEGCGNKGFKKSTIDENTIIASCDSQITSNIDYNENYIIYQFPDKIACRKEINPTKLGLYTQTNLKNIPFETNTYIKLFDELNDKPISRCTQAINQTPWRLDFEPYQCHGKRKLIIISTSEKFNSYGKQIPQTISKVFQNQLDSKIPFTLVTILPGRKLSKPLLKCEDLADLEKTEAEKFIWQQLNNIRFGARDLHALQNLDLANIVYAKEKLQSVIYLTDNSKIPTDIKYINDKDLSVPIITWKKSGIPLTVLTIDSCLPWIKKAEATECQELTDKTAIKQIQQALKKFLEY